jgi:serine/threonine protein kinase
MCGNPEYLAPEVVLSKGHFKAVDLWGFGVLLYEMVKGYTPFTHHDYHGNLTIIYQNILHSKDVLSRNETFQSFDKSMIQFVKDLLNDNPYMRMGMLRDGIKDIWNHPFLAGYDQAKIYHRSLTAPYNPTDNIDSIDSIFIFEDINIEEAPEYTGTFDFSTF